MEIQQGACWNYVSLCTYVFLSLYAPGLGPAEVVASSPFAFGLFWQLPLPAYLLFLLPFSQCLPAGLPSVAGLRKQPLDIAAEGREG